MEPITDGPGFLVTPLVVVMPLTTGAGGWRAGMVTAVNSVTGYQTLVRPFERSLRAGHFSAHTGYLRSESGRCARSGCAAAGRPAAAPTGTCTGRITIGSGARAGGSARPTCAG